MLIEKSIRQAQQLNQLDPEAKVNWREIAFGQPQGGLKLSLSGQVPDAEVDRSGG